MLYVLLRLFRYLEFDVPEVINSHLTDFLFMPILLTVSLVGVRILKRDEKIKLTIAMIVVSFIFVSLVFELLMPSRSILFISDFWDVIAYGLGAFFFYFTQAKFEVQNSTSVEKLF